MDIKKRVQDIVSDMSTDMNTKINLLKELSFLDINDEVKDLLERYVIYLYKTLTTFYKESDEVVYTGQYFCNEDESPTDGEIISHSLEDVKNHIFQESIDDGLEEMFIRRVVIGKEVNYIEGCFDSNGLLVGLMSSEPSEEEYYFLAD